MPSIPGAVGGSYVLRQPFIACEQAINWFYETIQGQGKRRGYLRSRAGLRPFASVDDSPGRGGFAQDGRVFVAVGSTFAEIFEDGTSLAYGTIENTNGLPVWFCSNGSAGHQLFFTSDGKGYIFDLNDATFTELSGDFPDNVWQPVFMDGYFLVSIRDTRQFRWSALEDGLTWDLLNVAERSIASDNIVSFIRLHRSLYLIGSQTTEVWYDQGDPLVPFAPQQGVLLEVGCSAGYSAQRVEGTLAWIMQNELGGATVVTASGDNPVKLSTYAIDLTLQDSGNLEFVSASAFQQKGHQFYQINLPPNEAPLSPVFDITEAKLGTPNPWHQRAMWNTTTCAFEQDLAAAHMFGFSKNLMVSRLDGTIYWLRDDVYTDQVIA